MEAMFGSTLVSAGGSTVDTASKFGDDIQMVGIYFSAHWCPPCRAFTPILADFYNAVNKDGRKLEIVFISHDRDEASFQDYLKSMPWLAIPFDGGDLKEKIITEHKVSGIPKLVFITKDGKVMFEDGRGKVQSDPKGASFPWS